ncbi:MAG: LruC domain-containing protein [Bacteroidia bacterium]|nr:LruC domain-containing protein [Bacteroidia bacterium]
MRRVNFFPLVVIALAMTILQSCIKEEDFSQTTPPKPESEYFDFSSMQSIQLNIDYGFDGYTALFEVYTENPFDENRSKITSVESAFKAFTDGSCSFSGKIEVPAHTTKIYLYSTSRAIPRCIEVPIINGTATYQYAAPDAQTARTRAVPEINLGSAPRTLYSPYKFYSLYDRYTPYDVYSNQWMPGNSKVSKLYSIVPSNTKLSNESTLGQLMERIERALVKTNNSALVANENVINISVANKTANGTPVDGVRLDLVFLDNNGDFHSSMAYYYYKTGANLTGEEIKQLPKYFVIPRMTSGTPNKAVKARLQFFGENGDQPGTDLFPPGYTVGWMVVANMFPSDGSAYFWKDLSTIEPRIKWAYESEHVIYSNQSANYKQQSGCISLYDQKSKRIVLGFEDQTYRDENDRSFEDILYYVEADPIDAVLDPSRPEIPVVGNGDNITATETTKGTLAFEDVWPTGGDYDLNDVIIEYRSDVEFDRKNQITRITETFTPVNKKNSALNTNAFGYVINDNLGTINLAESNYSVLEEGNQIILCPNVKEVAEENVTYKVVRDFTTPISKLTYKRNWNPFIVVNYKAGVKKRVEVHLPKHQPTSWADESLVGTKDDAYFINKDGKFPFAIDLPISGFEPVTETKRIGTTDEYPTFKDWAEGFGSTHADWYKHKK